MSEPGQLRCVMAQLNLIVGDVDVNTSLIVSAANEELYKAEQPQQEVAQPAPASSGEADMTDAEALMEAGCVTFSKGHHCT